jgi:hypothetical protein
MPARRVAGPARGRGGERGISQAMGVMHKPAPHLCITAIRLIQPRQLEIAAPAPSRRAAMGALSSPQGRAWGGGAGETA